MVKDKKSEIKVVEIYRHVFHGWKVDDPRLSPEECLSPTEFLRKAHADGWIVERHVVLDPENYHLILKRETAKREKLKKLA